MSPRNPSILGSKGQRSRSRGTTNSAGGRGAGFCTLALHSSLFYFAIITVC